RTFGGYLNDYGFSLVECSGGGFAITGSTSSFGAGLGDAWLVRTDASGNHLWNRTFGGPEYETGNSVVEYGGSFTITGWTRSYGAGDTDVWLVRVRMPVWVEMPTNQTVEWCNSFYYDLNATSEAGIDQYWLNDTAHFITDIAGVITNVTPLAMGVYGLQVFVNDTLGNELSTEFTVTMQDTLGPVWLIGPTDQVIEYGASLSLQLSASDPSGVDHWSVNDITHFAISSTGLLTSLNILAVGDYDIQVTVSDIYNNDRSATCTISVQDTTAPTWVTQPSNYLLAYGETLSSQLNATDLSGIDSWTVNNTWHFAISSTGLLTSVGILNPGVYGLSVTVRDPYSNAQSATCTVRVEEIPETPQIPGFPLAAIILGMTATLGLLIIIRRQRKSK
ncbi:MAG: hypothetical protein ACFFDJ_07735, partial [Candidatus Odinarchaeota archaeon]